MSYLAFKTPIDYVANELLDEVKSQAELVNEKESDTETIKNELENSLSQLKKYFVA